MKEKVESRKKKVESNERIKSETALREEQVLAFWKEQGIFEKSLAKDAPKGEFVFYDGPPFATGLPHMGHLLISAYKDAIGRYKTMRGYTVPRTWGWDCHGLPIENIVEKKLGLKTKKDIEEMGVARFNEEARNSVLTYVSDWKEYVERLGRWVDFDHSYKTMDNSYIESVWWGLKKIYDDGRLYEGRKVLMFCPHCETPLSKAEIAMDNSYKDVTDTAVYVKFQLVESRKKKEESIDVRKALGIPDDGKPIYILAWTTTPWTLPANVALAINSKEDYVWWKTDTGYLIAEMMRATTLFLKGAEDEVVNEFSGSELVGLSYEPLYEVPKAKLVGSEKAWTIQAADFVTTEEGTGVVHIAPMYGEDDYKLGQEHGLPAVPLLDATGTYNADAPELVRGMFYKKGGKYVMEDLERRGLLFGSHEHTHSYPHCYRCGTALIYNALTSWFINIQKVKEHLREANEEVTWYPEHLKHGRFANIIETAPDWTISRNRFWASPLPIWKHEKTGEVTMIGSLKELRARTRTSGNAYFLIRHGEAQSNVSKTISTRLEGTHHVTEKGKGQIDAALATLKKKGITKIVASPILRTKETAEHIARGIGYAIDDIVYDERLMEWQLGGLDGKPVATLREVCPTYEDRFLRGCGTGETLMDMKRRIGAALYEYEERFSGETILIVGHEYTAWLAECVARGASVAECILIRGTAEDYVKNGEVRALEFVPLSHNGEYELDLHRPYIDDLPLVAEDGVRLVRIPEVVDCWVESGSMPFASEHYPHENEALVRRRYPGDFIAEYIAQTRTWFYYMHALGVLLFDAPSFKNCVSTGTILAADGSKMSKSKGNFTDPRLNIDQYGADALRYYLLGSVVMAGEDLAFKDEELREAHNRFVGILWNSYKFYEMNADGVASNGSRVTSTHVLDRWILARLDQLVREVTDYLDAYDTVRTARALRDFVSDLSTWYIRRSRERFKGDDTVDRDAALGTSAHVFRTLATLVAPVTPFIAEDIYRGAAGSEESVHLAAWPTAELLSDAATCLLADMTEVRRVASLVLEARQKVGIKVRQPLASVTLANDALKGKEELLAILADEVNVKVVQFGSGFEGGVLLDTTITPELRTEGDIRELVRAVQDLRKQAGLNPEDKVTLSVDTDDTGKALVESARTDLGRVAGVADIEYKADVQGAAVKLEGAVVKVAIQ